MTTADATAPAPERQMESPERLTSEDRLWAAVAHGSVIISSWGPLLAVVVWFTQRKQSAYARFHALQAMSYQVLCMWLWMTLGPVLAIIGGVIALLAGGVPPPGSPADDPSTVFRLMLLVSLPILAILALFVLIGIIGAVACLMGREFRYPFIGPPLARKLNYSAADRSSMSDEQEDQVAGAIGHAASAATLFGVATPFLLWITQRDRSPFLRFQALQATIYQAAAGLVYLGIMMLYMVLSFVVLIPLIGLIVFLPMMCLLAFMFIAGPLYQLFAFIASLQVLRGNDYNYPWLGKYLRRRMDQPQPAPEASA